MITYSTQLLEGASEPIWTFPTGDASLYVGQAIDMLSRIPDETVDCVWTDPPYLLSNGGIICVAGRMVSVEVVTKYRVND